LDSWTTSLTLQSTSTTINIGKRASTYVLNTTDGNRPRYQVTTKLLSKFLISWATFSLGKTTHIKFVEKNGSITGFCILHLTWETESLMIISLRFFNVDFQVKDTIIRSFKSGLNSIEHSSKHTTVYPIKSYMKPVQLLLISYTPQPLKLILNWNQNRDPFNLFFVPQEVAARFFLRHHAWIWFADLKAPTNEIRSLLLNAFISLYNSKIQDGYLRIFEAPGTVTFYKEHDKCATQYVLLWNPTNNFLMTEIWIEPNTDENNVYESIKQTFYENDFNLLAQLFSYEYGINSSTFKYNPFRKEICKNLEYVETSFQVFAMYRSSNMFFLSFKPLFSEELGNMVKNDFSNRVVIELPTGSEFGISLENFDEMQSQIDWIADKRLEGKSVQESSNMVLWEFFKRYISDIFDHSIRWCPSALVDPIHEKLVKELKSLQIPILKDSEIFFKVIDNNLIMLIFPCFTISKSMSISLLHCEKFKPLETIETPRYSKSEEYVIEILPEPTQVEDGQVFLHMSSYNFRSSSRTPPIDSMRYIFKSENSLEELDSVETLLRKEIFQLITKSFYQSMTKALYFSLLKNSTPLDIERALLKSSLFKMHVNLTDFVAVHETLGKKGKQIDLLKIQSFCNLAIEKSFSRIYGENLKPGGLFYFRDVGRLVASNHDRNTGDDIFTVSNTPVFIRLYSEENGIMLESNEIPLEFQDHRPLIQSDNDLFILPSAENINTMNWVIEVFATDHDIIIQKSAIEELKKSVMRLLEDYVLLGLLNLNINVEKTIMTVASILKTRESKMELDVDCKNITDGQFTFSLYYSYELKFADSLCLSYFEERLKDVTYCGLHFRHSCGIFFVMNEKELCPFWIVLSNDDSISKVYLFGSDCSEDDLNTLLERIKGILDMCVFWANQRFLLQELKETHMARESLGFEFDSYLPKINYQDSLLYRFACPEQHRHVFPIHPRLTPAGVLNNILSFLQAISIQNRPGTLAYSENFFMKFEFIEQNESSSPLTILTDLLDSKPKQKPEQGLIFKVYGLTPPETPITVEFIKMIGSKIDTMIQTAIGALLARNPSAKLTRSDLAFVMPVEKEISPSFHTTYLLVPELENIHLYIVLLRQFLTLFTSPMVSAELPYILNEFYESKYHKKCPDLGRQKSSKNELHLGDLVFMYNCVPSRHLTELEISVGLGLVTIIITPIDNDNQILFPSTASAVLWNNQNVVLDDNSFCVKKSIDDEEVKNWNGFKVAVTMWVKGIVNLNPLSEKITSAFQNTLIDYTIESYFRSSNYSVLSQNRLPELSKTNLCEEREIISPEIINSIKTLPLIFNTGGARENPVIQHISIESSLPLDTIARQTRRILTEDDIQAYFFSKVDDTLNLIEELPSEGDGKYKNYWITGSYDIFEPKSELYRRQSMVSDASSNYSSPKLGSTKMIKSNSADSNCESPDQKTSRVSLLGDFEEVFMFPDFFYPFFPRYGKRSSFFILALHEHKITVSTYNVIVFNKWKKSESDIFFLKLIKVLNWVKINQQFNERKLKFSHLKIAKFKDLDFGKQNYTIIGPSLRFSDSFASKFSALDFIYHIGGFDAVYLQTEIVNYLELFFRFGQKPIKIHIREKSSSLNTATALSLTEMSNVLQSISLIHSSSSPIFFSECCLNLMNKWSGIDGENFLSLTKSISEIAPQVSKLQNAEKQEWFKKMIATYLESYVEYLEHLGMEKVQFDKGEWELNKTGGSLAVNDKEMVEASSLFLRKYFNGKVILVQCGFYSYFATVNVMTFSYDAPDDTLVTKTDDFAKECSHIIQFSHIVSFSYDFHLRYIQDILFQPDASDMPMELVQMMRVFTTLNPRKSRFSRNRIVRGAYREENESVELFRYILFHPTLYGFQPIIRNGKPTAFGITVSSPIQTKAATNTPFDYTLIVSEAEKVSGVKSNFFEIEYFILVVDKENSFPHLKLNEIGEIAQNIEMDPLLEYIGGGYYLRDIVVAFEKRIEELIQKV
jgi:hypothetical protein